MYAISLLTFSLCACIVQEKDGDKWKVPEDQHWDFGETAGTKASATASGAPATKIASAPATKSGASAKSKKKMKEMMRGGGKARKSKVP